MLGPRPLALGVLLSLALVVVYAHGVAFDKFPLANGIPNDTKPLNDWPVIGIMAQPYKGGSDPHFKQYIAASYVKWIESAGGRVVPIDYYITKETADKLIPNLNGILWPGGGADFNPNHAYVMDLVIKLNKQGIYMPMWGTCMGFQFLTMYFTQNNKILIPTQSYNISYPLIFEPEAYEARLIQAVGPQATLWMADPNKNVTLNNHHWSLAVSDFRRYMGKNFRLISTNFDDNGVEFVSTWESKDFPVYAVQWHPEKNNFEHDRDPQTGLPYEQIPHTMEAVRVSQALANFFVDEARKCPNKFADWKLEQKLLIKNYQVYVTGPGFEQSYLFNAFNM